MFGRGGWIIRGSVKKGFHPVLSNFHRQSSDNFGKLTKYSEMTRNVWMALGQFLELVGEMEISVVSLRQSSENFRENESVTSEWFSNNLWKIFNFSLYAVSNALAKLCSPFWRYTAECDIREEIFEHTRNSQILKIKSLVKSFWGSVRPESIYNFSLSLFQVHGLWKDKANREEGDDTDEPPMSPASPPGTKICFE